ncbi:hypothetical protein PAHAL_4G312400 [Panicum hallii]|uniref:Uncharacterized protein n=1 Tax=Panicum hallii TaxID=206008 RepID=A0A2T8JEL5_9POAL|nr:hypothetical protein PAHAL_4G312400 [Panicum hallii]
MVLLFYIINSLCDCRFLIIYIKSQSRCVQAQHHSFAGHCMVAFDQSSYSARMSTSNVHTFGLNSYSGSLAASSMHAFCSDVDGLALADDIKERNGRPRDEMVEAVEAGEPCAPLWRLLRWCAGRRRAACSAAPCDSSLSSASHTSV